MAKTRESSLAALGRNNGTTILKIHGLSLNPPVSLIANPSPLDALL